MSTSSVGFLRRLGGLTWGDDCCDSCLEMHSLEEGMLKCWVLLKYSLV